LNREIVKRWVNEIQEALNSKSPITQYHALGLLYLIRQHDRIAIIKLIQSCSKLNFRSPQAHCLLIKYSAKIINEEPPQQPRPMFDILEGYLRHKR
jgi:coatomer protein complex subunit gamma